MSMYEPIKPGDRFTIAGCYRWRKNPDRRWWQFWKPREVMSSELEVFTAVMPYPLVERA